MKWTLMIYPIVLIGSMGCLKTRAELSSTRNYQDNQIQVAQMQKSSSFDSNTRLGEVEEALRTITGKLEELEHRQKELEKSSDKLENLEKSPVILDLNRKLTLILEELKGQKAELNDLKGQVLSAQEKAQMASAKDPFTHAEELFEEKDYRRAILSYQKYRDQSPKGAKFAEATYKIGFSFEKLNMNAEAKSFYNEVIEKYPKSPEAQKAKIRLKKLK
jgi:TolA-binding protein